MKLLLKLFKPDRKLGVAQGKRRYDLPLNKNIGTGFLVLLIALMTFLAVMALAGSFALGSMTGNWTSGLENKLTIEIPVEKSDGDLRTPDDVAYLIERIEKILTGDSQIKTLEVMQENELKEMIKPWIGSGAILKDIPLPGLISVELHTSTPEIINGLEKRLKHINKDIRLETHQSWLADLMRLTGALKFSTFLISIIIGATTLTAVAGAIRSRLAVHRADVELLHLMGANDNYICRQFQRHSFIMALQGSSVGTALGALVLIIIGVTASDTGAALLPDFSMSAFHIFSIIAIPAIACTISVLVTRFTVLRVLSMMP